MSGNLSYCRYGRNQPCQFLFCGDGVCPRARGIASEVYDVGSLCHHLRHPGGHAVGRDAASGKEAVGSDVYDSHHCRTIEFDQISPYVQYHF